MHSHTWEEAREKEGIRERGGRGETRGDKSVYI